MKSLIVFCFLLPFFGHSQDLHLPEEIILPVNPITNRISYSEVVSVPEKKVTELYPKAKEWFIKTYNSGKDVIQLDDAVNGKIIGKGFSAFQIEVNGSIIKFDMWYLLTISIKDGKYKYIVTDFDLVETLDDLEPSKRTLEVALATLEKNSTGSPMGKKLLNDEKYVINQKVSNLISSLKSQMISKDDF